MKQCIEIPRGWQRVIKSQIVVYITPSQDELKSKDDILQYLTAPGTCKCGLQCPLHLDSLFSFDISIKSKEIQTKTTRLSSNQIDKPFAKNRSDVQPEAVKGPPVSHSCSLKPSKVSRVDSAKTVHTTINRQTSTLVARQVSDDKNITESNLKISSDLQNTKSIDFINVSATNQLPPISIFCQVNKYTVHQILQHLYSSLENTTNHLKSSLSKQISNPERDIKDNCIADSDAIFHQRQNESREIKNKTLTCLNKSSSNIKDNFSNVNNSVPRFPVQNNFNIQLPPQKVHIINNRENHVLSNSSTFDRDRNNIIPSPDATHTKAKQCKNPVLGSRFQIVQNEPNRTSNNSTTEPSQCVRSQGKQNQHKKFSTNISSQTMSKSSDNSFNVPHYPYHQIPKPEVYCDERLIKNKFKSKSKQLSKCSRQPAIVIQTDQGKSCVAVSSKPTLLVSLREKIEKKGDKPITKNSCLSSLDANLTSVDSILKTCSYPNLGNISDIDQDDCDSVNVKVNKLSESSSKFTEHTAVSYNSIIPAQYLTPGNLIYGVPLIQNDPKSNRDHKTKCVEKWEGVLSPSEVDAKVQQILSSPQKVDESSNSNDKDGSPKKRKRQQSAPHMYDRYPGNPSLRFQTGHAIKSSKSSKCEPQIPMSNIMMSPLGLGPIMHSLPVPSMPHWGQFSNQISSHNFSLYQAMKGNCPIADTDISDGRKSR